MIPSFVTPASVSASSGPAQEQVRDAAVEPRDDDTDRPLGSERSAFEHRVAVGNIDLAAYVLDAHVGGDVLDQGRGIRGGPALERVAEVGAVLLRLDLVLDLDLGLGHGVGLSLDLDLGLGPGLVRRRGLGGLRARVFELRFVSVGHAFSDS